MAKASKTDLEDALHLDNEETISVLIRDNELLKMDLNSCESALQKALNSKDQVGEWYYSPGVIIGGAAGTMLIGVLIGASLSK